MKFLTLLLLVSCRVPEGALDQAMGDLRAGPRPPLVDPRVRGLCVAIAPDPATAVNPEEDQLKSMAVREADLKDVLAVFFKDSDLNLDLDKDVSGPTTFDYKRTTVSDAFLSVLDANGLGFRHEGDFIRIAKTETRIYHFNSMAAPGGGAAGGFADVLKGITDLGSSSAPAAKVVANESAGTIAVTANTSDLKRIENYLEKVQEVVGRQVLIEARIFEVSLTDAAGFGFNALLQKGYFNTDKSGLVGSGDVGISDQDDGLLGIQSGANLASSGLKFGILKDGYYALAMNAFQTQGQVRVLSAPRVMSLNNQPASIDLKDQVPVIAQDVSNTSGVGQTTTTKITFVDAGITIKVTPQITDSGDIWAQIAPSVTTVAKTVTVGATSAPQLVTRTTNATLHVRDGQTIVLGGIRSIRKNEANSGIPILMDIPLLGALFRSNSQEKGETELVIMMTPTIVSPDVMPFLVEEGLSRVERIQYPFHLGFFNMNNAEDMATPLPPADQVNLTYGKDQQPTKAPDQTITRRGLARIFLNRGIRDFDNKKKLMARSKFEQSMNFHKLEGEALVYLGLIALSEADRSKAKEYFEKEIAINPKDGTALNNRGILDLLEGNPLIAESYLRKATAAIPNNPHAWNNLGLAYSMLEQKERAREAFGTAIGLDPNHAEANYNLAHLYDAEGFEQAAIPHYEAFLDSLPNQSKPQTVHAAQRLLALRK